MLINQSVKIQPNFHIVVKDVLNRVIYDINTHNIAVNTGFAYLAQWLSSPSQSSYFMPYVQLGTLNTLLAASVLIGATSINVNTDILTGSTGSIVVGVGNADSEVVSVSAKTGSNPTTYTISALVNNHSLGEGVVVNPSGNDTQLGNKLGVSATLSTFTYTSGASYILNTTFNSVGATISEAGIFSASTGSGTATMFAHVVFAPLDLNVNDSITTYWTILFN